MALNVYLVPAVTGTGINASLHAKYFGGGEQFDGKYQAASVPYGGEPTFLVAVRDILPADDASVSAQADVLAVPALAQTVGAQVAAVQSRLEALNIPGQWVTAGMSYGSVCRFVAVFFLLAERLNDQLGRARLFGGTVTLATQWNQLPAGVKQDLLDLAAALNFNTTGMSGATTIRQILKALADQWAAVSLSFGSLVL